MFIPSKQVQKYSKMNENAITSKQLNSSALSLSNIKPLLNLFFNIHIFGLTGLPTTI